MEFFAAGAVVLVLIGLMAFGLTRPGGRGTSSGPGPGAMGAVYDLLNEDKRRAIEIIVEQKAEATDPETADDLPPEDDGEGAIDQDSAGSGTPSKRSRSNV